MRYYCKNCGGVFETEREITTPYNYQCPACGCYLDWNKIKIPDYETPEQYEKRTGKVYHDEWPVWLRVDQGDTEDLVLLENKKGVNLMSYLAAKNFKKNIYYLVTVLGFQLSDTPPDNWKSEEAV